MGILFTISLEEICILFRPIMNVSSIRKDFACRCLKARYKTLEIQNRVTRNIFSISRCLIDVSLFLFLFHSPLLTNCFGYFDIQIFLYIIYEYLRTIQNFSKKRKTFFLRRSENKHRY